MHYQYVKYAVMTVIAIQQQYSNNRLTSDSGASRLLRACLWFCVATVEQRVGLSCCWLGLASLLPRGIAAQHEVQNLIPYQFQTE